jgi:hypothetical protein
MSFMLKRKHILHWTNLVYKTGLSIDHIHRPISSIEHDVLRLALSPSSGRCNEVKPIQLGPVERAIVDHWTNPSQ